MVAEAATERPIQAVRAVGRGTPGVWGCPCRERPGADHSGPERWRFDAAAGRRRGRGRARFRTAVSGGAELPFSGCSHHSYHDAAFYRPEKDVQISITRNPLVSGANPFLWLYQPVVFFISSGAGVQSRISRSTRSLILPFASRTAHLSPSLLINTGTTS